MIKPAVLTKLYLQDRIEDSVSEIRQEIGLLRKDISAIQDDSRGANLVADQSPVL